MDEDDYLDQFRDYVFEEEKERLKDSREFYEEYGHPPGISESQLLGLSDSDFF